MLIKVAELASGPVRYLETGGGKAMVLVHAFPLSAEQWLPQLAKVPPGWRVIAPDLRGFGGGVLGLRDVTIQSYADDVVALMDHLDVHQAVVGGLSMGGYVALAMMRTAAERVSGLVLADTRATADSPEARAGRDRMVAVLESEGPKGVAREMIPKLLGETTRSERRDLVEAVEQLIERNGTDGIRAAILAMKARPDASDVLPTIRCPTLVICGAEDTVTPPAESEVLHKAISGSRLAIIPSAGHLSNLENPMGFMGTGLFSTDFHPPGPGLW